MVGLDYARWTQAIERGQEPGADEQP